MEFEVTRELVRTILQRASNYQWTVQGFGMLRLYLAKVGRIHLWDSRVRTGNVSDMHTHPWPLRSTIIAGEIVNERYAEIPEALSPALADALACGERRAMWAQLLQTGEGGGLKGAPREVVVRRMSREIYRAGNVYSQRPAEIHVSLPVDGCVTIMERPKGPDFTEHAWVYWDREAGRMGWVSAEPRPATIREVGQAAAHALETWELFPRGGCR